MPDPLSAADIAEGQRLDRAATGGPWETYVSRTDVLPGRETREIVRPNGDLHPWNVLKVGNTCCWPPTDADAELIVWARNHLPALLDAAEKVAELPRRIETVAELEALPDNSIIRWEASSGLSRGMIERFDGGWWQPGNHIRLTTERIPLPAILIWTPKDPS